MAPSTASLIVVRYIEWYTLCYMLHNKAAIPYIEGSVNMPCIQSRVKSLRLIHLIQVESWECEKNLSWFVKADMKVWLFLRSTDAVNDLFQKVSRYIVAYTFLLQMGNSIKSDIEVKLTLNCTDTERYCTVFQKLPHCSSVHVSVTAERVVLGSIPIEFFY